MIDPIGFLCGGVQYFVGLPYVISNVSLHIGNILFCCQIVLNQRAQQQDNSAVFTIEQFLLDRCALLDLCSESFRKSLGPLYRAVLTHQ